MRNFAYAVLLLVVVLGLAIFHSTTYRWWHYCEPLYNYLTLVDLWCFFLLTVGLTLRKFKHQAKMGMRLAFGCMVVVGIVTPPAFYRLAMIGILETKCFPTTKWKLDLVTLGCLFIAEIGIFVLIICRAFGLCNEDISREEEFNKVYEEIFKPEFKLPKFLDKHSSTIDSGLTEKELSVLNDKFGQESTGEGPHKDLNCLVCSTKIEKGNRMVLHPQCNHSFHFECISASVERVTETGVCPSCKIGTRKAMLFQLRLNTFGQLDAPSTTYLSSSFDN